jgi:hypothetical protein
MISGQDMRGDLAEPTATTQLVHRDLDEQTWLQE